MRPWFWQTSAIGWLASRGHIPLLWIGLARGTIVCFLGGEVAGRSRSGKHALAIAKPVHISQCRLRVNAASASQLAGPPRLFGRAGAQPLALVLLSAPFDDQTYAPLIAADGGADNDPASRSGELGVSLLRRFAWVQPDLPRADRHSHGPACGGAGDGWTGRRPWYTRSVVSAIRGSEWHWGR